jgi:hypothetical protein
MNSYSKTIVLNSPPGSGGIFCRELLNHNLEAELVWPKHNLLGFQKNDVNICVIRNPYDVLASGIEVGFKDLPKEIEEFFMGDVDLMISDQLPYHVGNYYRFLNFAKKVDYVTPISFEFLTEQPDKFLQHISQKFDIPFRKNLVTSEEVKAIISRHEDQSTRVPREKTDFRKKIDEVVKKYKPVENLYSEYILFKDTIQSTENML